MVRDRRLGGYKFKRQHPVGNYIADFACLEAKLIVELDGGQHAEKQEYDAKRDAFFQSEGFRIVRFWNAEFLKNQDGVARQLLAHLDCVTPSLTPALSPGSGGEGAMMRQMACKPGSVFGVSRWMAIPLGRLSPGASRDLPGRQPGNRPVPSLFGLAPGGACPAASVAVRAVRSCRTVSPLPRPKPVGGLFSVALSLGSPPPDVIRHRVSVEPGLSSSRASGQRPSGHLTRRRYNTLKKRAGRLQASARSTAASA